MGESVLRPGLTSRHFKSRSWFSALPVFVSQRDATKNLSSRPFGRKGKRLNITLPDHIPWHTRSKRCIAQRLWVAYVKCRLAVRTITPGTDARSGVLRLPNARDLPNGTDLITTVKRPNKTWRQVPDSLCPPRTGKEFSSPHKASRRPPNIVISRRGRWCTCPRLAQERHASSRRRPVLCGGSLKRLFGYKIV